MVAASDDDYLIDAYGVDKSVFVVYAATPISLEVVF